MVLSEAQGLLLFRVVLETGSSYILGEELQATKFSVLSLVDDTILRLASRRCGSAKMVWPIPSLCGGIILGAKAKQVNVLRGINSAKLQGQLPMFFL